MFRRWALIAGLAALCWGSPLSAQETYVGISAFGGAFFPTADLVAGDFKQKTGFAFGGRLSLWTLRRFAVELEGAYAMSDVEYYAGKESGWVGFFSLNLLYSIVKPPLEPLDIYVTGGLGFVKRGSDAFDVDEITELTDAAGTLGLGISYAIQRNLYIRVDLRDYISWFQAPGSKSQMQNDLLVTAGIEVRPRLGS